MTKLRINEQGRVFRGNIEIFELTIHEQDEIIKQLYPTDSQLMSIAEWRKKQTSWSGTSAFNLDYFESKSTEYVDVGSCEIAERIYKWGGQRLLTLYCHKFNFDGAAMDLGMTYGALMKWFQRKRTQLLAIGVTPQSIFRDPDEIILPINQ